jgi:diguanylate cyclase (GGDEF)-like protein
MERSSWLFPDGVDRERMLDMDRQLRPVRRLSFGVLALTLVACGPWLGWWTLIPLALAALIFRVVDGRLDRLQRPEYGLFAAWAASQTIIAAAVALTGGAGIATTSWLALPLVTLGARFSERGVAVGVAYSLALLVAVAFGVDAAAVTDDPTNLLAPAALMIGIALFQTVLMRSDVKHRKEAVVDPLTGMLNRNALRQRTAELAQQAAVTRLPVGVVVGDIDHFKRVNDSAGHAAGDAVLTDVAYTLRKALRAFDLAYRIGGEEFLVLLPGADAERSRELAEDLRVAVSAGPQAGHPVTMSFGIAASQAGEPFEYERVFAAADAALYDAKQSGRNRVSPEAAAPLLAA